MKTWKRMNGVGLRIFTYLALFLSGAGASSAFAVSVFSTDFNAGAPPEFSGVTTTEGVQGYAGLGTGLNVFGGNFLRNTTAPPLKTTLTLAGLPAHTDVTLSFLLAIIDSWDGSGGHGFGPDIFNVTVDGSSILAETFDNFFDVQSYAPPAGVLLSSGSSVGFAGWPDSAYNMGLDPIFSNIPHTASTLTVEWFAGGAGWQGGGDESWAIDNVEVSVNRTPPVSSVPEPVSLLLMGSGFVGMMVMRRKKA